MQVSGLQPYEQLLASLYLHTYLCFLLTIVEMVKAHRHSADQTISGIALNLIQIACV